MTTDRRLSRRGLLRGGLGAAAAIGAAGTLSGCGSAFARGIVGTQLGSGTLTYWNLFSGGDGGRMQAMEDGYRKSPGASGLQAATFAWGNPYYTKVTLATVGGAPPDLAISHLTRSTNLAKAGLLTEITDDTLSLAGLSVDSFDPVPYAAQKVGGKTYALPLDIHPYVLFYNTDVCKKAGLLDGDGNLKPIHGTQEWEAALTAAKKVTGAWGCTTPTIGDTSTSWRWFQTLYSQMNGSTPWLGDNGRRLTYNEDLVIKTLAYIRKLTKSGLMPATVDGGGAEQALFAGKTAFYLMGDWEITTAQSIPGFKFGMTSIPVIFDKRAEQADSHCFILPSKQRDEARLKATMGLIKSLLDQSMIWAKGGHIPAYMPVRTSDAYKRLKPQANYADAAKYAVYDAPGWYSGSGSNFENVVGAQIGLVQQGLATPKAALAQARSQLLIYANTESPI